MTRYTYLVDVGRVVVRGAGAEGVGAAELRVLVEHAVVREVADAPLPAGTTVRASTQVSAPPLAAGARGLAGTIATGVAHAIGGGPSRG